MHESPSLPVPLLTHDHRGAGLVIQHTCPAAHCHGFWLHGGGDVDDGLLLAHAAANVGRTKPSGPRRLLTNDVMVGPPRTGRSRLAPGPRAAVLSQPDLRAGVERAGGAERRGTFLVPG